MTRLPTLLTALTLLTVAGCGPMDSQPPPGQDWFGNPAPTEGACADRIPVPRQRPPFNPADGATVRPPAVPPGWRWVVITLRLHAVGVRSDGVWDVNHCVPVQVHVDARQQFNPRPIKMNMGDGTVTPLPYDGVQITPFTTTYFIFGYNPDGYDRDIPPRYEIDFAAFWDATFHKREGVTSPRQLVCHIGIGGGLEVARAESNPSARGRLTADCKHAGNHYWQ